jgi:hypothetical protein
MDKNENLRDIRAELAGSRLARPERARAQAQASEIKAELAESQPTPAKAADAEPHAASSPPASTSQLGQVTPGEASSQRTTTGGPRPTDRRHRPMLHPPWKQTIRCAISSSNSLLSSQRSRAPIPA